MFDSLVLIVVLSFLIPFISIKIMGGVIPSVALEIIVGIAVGTSGLNLIDTNSVVMEFLSTFGLLYLMFLGGLETDFDIQGLKSKYFIRSPSFIAFLTFIFTLILSYLFSVFIISLFHCSGNALYLTLVFSTTSVAIVFPTLKSRQDIKKIYKQTLATSALIADFATLLMIAVFALLEEGKNNVTDIIIMSLIFIFAFLAKKIIHTTMKNRWIVKTVNMLKHKSHIQMGIRGSFAILFIFLFLAEKLGIEIILGSFIAGMIISKVSERESEVLLLKLDAMGYGFFIPFFFIYQGAKSKLPIFSTEGILFFLVIIIGSFAIKILAAAPLKLRFTLKEAIAGGFLLSGRLSLIIAASIIGLKLGIIDNQINSAIILLAAFSCVLSPSFFSLIERKKTVQTSSKIVIIGGGRVGSNIAKRLNEKGKSVILIEKDEKKCKSLKSRCTSAVYCGDALDMQLWEKIKPTFKDTALLVTNSDKINLKVAEILSDEFNVYKLFARDNDPKNRDLFKQKGIVPLIYTEALIKIIENAIENPTTFELISGSKKVISERIINKLSGKSIKQSGLALYIEIILIKRGSNWLYPFDDFLLRKNDILIFIMDKDDCKIIEKIEF